MEITFNVINNPCSTSNTYHHESIITIIQNDKEYTLRSEVYFQKNYFNVKDKRNIEKNFTLSIIKHPFNSLNITDIKIYQKNRIVIICGKKKFTFQMDKNNSIKFNAFHNQTMMNIDTSLRKIEKLQEKLFREYLRNEMKFDSNYYDRIDSENIDTI